MRIPVQTVEDLGLALRATRKAAKVRLDDLAGIVGVSKQFLGDVEYGKESVQLGLVLRLLDEMGISMTVEISDAAEPALSKLRAAGGVALKRRHPKAADVEKD